MTDGPCCWSVVCRLEILLFMCVSVVAVPKTVPQPPGSGVVMVPVFVLGGDVGAMVFDHARHR